MGHDLPDGDRPRELPPVSAFADDDGSPDPAVAAVLADHAAHRADLADVVAALATSRVLVPVLAHEAPEGVDDPFAEREAATAVVALRSPDGRTALPVFTGVAALAAWRPDARPMPAQVPRAAASALAEGWPLMVVDPGGPVTVVLPRPAVQALAAGLAWYPAVRDGVVRSDVRDAIVQAAASVAAVHSVDVEPGRQAEVAVIVGLARGLDRQGLEAVVAQVNERLAADPMVAQVDSLELRPVAAS